MLLKVTNYEFGVSFVYHVTLFGYCCYELFLANDDILKNANSGFVEGWNVIGRPKDAGSSDWNFLVNFLRKFFLFYILHGVLCEICRRIAKEYLSVCHAVIGSIFLLVTCSLETIAVVGLKIASFYLVASTTDSLIIVWLLGGIWQSVQLMIQFGYIFKFEDELQYYYLLSISSWGLLKALSFNVDRIKCKDPTDKKQYSFMKFCGYFLYFPTFVNGPIIVYSRYEKCLSDQGEDVRLFSRLWELAKNLARIGFWIVFMECALHFLYVHYLESNFEAVKRLNSCALFGFGWLMTHFFFTQYIICYGIGIECAKFDCIDAPKKPKCPGRIHFYSEMWKYFDVGLYEFLFKYIYCGVCDKSSSSIRKFLGNITTFAFVYVWHGAEHVLAIWSLLNFLCLYAEKMYKAFLLSSLFQNYLLPYLDADDETHLYRFLGGQILVPATISNFYFFAGMDTGNYFMAQTYYQPLNYLYLTTWSWCFVISSEYIWEKERKKKAIKQE